MRPISMPGRVTDHQTGMLAAAGAAFVYGAAYPATAVALRSFSPLGVAGWACTLALLLVILLAAGGLIDRPATANLSRPRLARLVLLAILGGAGFIAAINVAVALSGPTITGFIAPL